MPELCQLHLDPHLVYEHFDAMMTASGENEVAGGSMKLALDWLGDTLQASASDASEAISATTKNAMMIFFSKYDLL